jgi:hypothetical protein
MSLILLATSLSGLLASKLLLFLRVESIVVRYPLTVCCAYLAFFLFVKLWLAYMAASRSLGDLDGSGDLLSGLPDLSSGGSAPGLPSPRFGGGGGSGGGGGAAAAFDGQVTSVDAAVVPSPAGAGSASSGGGGSIGDAVSGFDLDDTVVIFIAIAVLLVSIFGAAIYLIYVAPHVLSEAAFDFLLGTSLVRSYRKMSHPDWMGSVLKATYKPFLLVLLVSFAAAWVIHANAPDLKKISDVFAR